MINLRIVFTAVMGFCLVQALPAKSSLKLTGGKGMVLKIQNREEVLEATDRYLSKADSRFLSVVENMENPFSFEQQPEEAVVGVATSDDGLVDVPATPVVYDDASILKAIGISLAKQVRGTMARGSTRYMQLQGGGLLRMGSSFPAKLPDLPGQEFNVTILEVTTEGFKIGMKELAETIPFATSSNSNSSISLSNE
ncbi:hypothetical protein [Coraliomargarita parva]|uniref:hypothetical protein n=1 Tax=Coraliomargarita parva TaxID=3014050 RepID=UPI0022B561B8|nr:hypothetical protein [Coraliomargarita parva]